MKKVKAFIERGNDGTYGVYMDNESLDYGLVGDGKTVNEAISDFYECLKEMKELYADEGKYFVEAEFEFCYDTASFLNYYSKFFSLAGLSRLTGIHQGQLSHYLTGHRRPSSKTVEKIEYSLQAFGREISQVEFA